MERLRKQVGFGASDPIGLATGRESASLRCRYMAGQERGVQCARPSARCSRAGLKHARTHTSCEIMQSVLSTA
jgi:hypothetical protein